MLKVALRPFKVENMGNNNFAISEKKRNFTPKFKKDEIC